MGFGDRNYILSVVDARTKEEITASVSCYVYDAGTKTLSTIYSNGARTALTNPVTFAAFSNRLDFWSASTSHDVFICDNRGNCGFYPSVTVNDHVLLLSRDGVSKHFVAPFLFNSGGTEVDTGLDFPEGVWIHRAMVEVVTLDATETLNVGLLASESGGDADGILAAVALGTAGMIRPWVVTDTTTEDYISTGYYGALMAISTTGSSAATDVGQPGGVGHIVTDGTAVSLSYTPSTSDTAAGYIHVYFDHVR